MAMKPALRRAGPTCARKLSVAAVYASAVGYRAIVRPHRCQVSDWFTSSSITPSQGAERRSARTLASQACWYEASPTSICHAPWKSQNSILAPVVSARNQSGRFASAQQ